MRWMALFVFVLTVKSAFAADCKDAYEKASKKGKPFTELKVALDNAAHPETYSSALDELFYDILKKYYKAVFPKKIVKVALAKQDYATEYQQVIKLINKGYQGEFCSGKKLYNRNEIIDWVIPQMRLTVEIR